MPPRTVHLIEAGIVTEQRSAGAVGAPAMLAGAFAERLHPEKRVRIPFTPRDRWLTAAREACRTLADAVSSSLAAGATPVVLGAEGTLVAGTVSGALSCETDLVLVYLAAHADYHTLATTKTHEVSGMALAHVSGHSVAPLLWPGARRIAEDHVVLVGARATEPGEAGNLARTKIIRVPFDAEHPDAPGLIAAVRKRAVWVHLDLDLLDPTECRAVIRPAVAGPPLRAIADVLKALGSAAAVRGVEVCGLDLTKEPEEKLPAALAQLIQDLLNAKAV
ncbi:MAG: hypothetical protein EXR61_04955 [Chloroflexi bacterium]|nr:hypothetical protein [Chloroflexota bacterium]